MFEAQDRQLCLVLTSSAGDSRAPTCRMPDSGLGFKVNIPAFGSNMREWFASYSQGSWWSRTLSLFSPGGLTRYSGRWPTSGTMQRGSAYELPTLVRPTEGNECSLWPTATAGDANSSGAAGYSTASGRHSGTTLTDAAVRKKRYPTPTSSDARRGRFRDATVGKLNPAWVDALMGFPDGWTEVEACQGDGQQAPTNPKHRGNHRKRSKVAPAEAQS